MATPRLFANASNTTPTGDSGTTLNQGFDNDTGAAPEWIAYQTATNTPITSAQGYVYVSGPDEATQTFYVAIAMSNTSGGGGSPPTIGWPDVAFTGCLTGDSEKTKIAVINQACAELASLALTQTPEVADIATNLETAGYPFSPEGSSGNFARALNGDSGAGAAGVAGKKLPILVFENGALV